MKHQSRSFAVVAFIATALLPASAAQAQWYSTAPAQQPPHYPYAVRSNQPYAVEVAPNTYVIRRPVRSRHYPYVHCANGWCYGARTTRGYRAPVGHRSYRHDDRMVIETERVEGVHGRAPAHLRRRQAELAERATREVMRKQVIKADAEVTILGPGRMIIRLYRKGDRAARVRTQ